MKVIFKLCIYAILSILLDMTFRLMHEANVLMRLTETNAGGVYGMDIVRKVIDFEPHIIILIGILMFSTDIINYIKTLIKEMRNE